MREASPDRGACRSRDPRRCGRAPPRWGRSPARFARPRRPKRRREAQHKRACTPMHTRARRSAIRSWHILLTTPCLRRYFAPTNRVIIGVQRSISLCMKRVTSAGLMALTSIASCSIWRFTCGRSKALTTSRLALSTMSGESPAGPESEYQVVATKSGWPSSRNVGIRTVGEPLPGGGGECHEPAGADMLGHDRPGQHADLHVTGDEIEHGLRAALVGHVHELDLFLCRQKFGDPVAHGAETRRDVFDAVGGAREREKIAIRGHAE